MPPGLLLASPGPLLASPGPLLASHGLFWAYPRFPGPLLGLSGQTGVSSPTRGSSRWIHLAPERDYSGRPSSMYMWSPHDIGRESWSLLQAQGFNEQVQVVVVVVASKLLLGVLVAA